MRIVALWLLVLSSGSAQAQQPAEFINAYVFGIRAEQAESAGQLNDALGHWEESLRLYQDSLRLHPDWTPSVVNYRINATANQIERIKGLVAAENKKKQTEATAAIQAQIDQAVAESRLVWQEEKKALDQRIAELTAERAVMLESNRVFESELQGNRELIAEVESTISTREKRIQQLEDGRDNAKKQTEALRADMAAKDEQNATKEEVIADLQRQLTNQPPPLITAEELEALRNDLTALQQQQIEADAPSADYEKTKVENIVFRDTIHAMSNQMAVLSEQVVQATDQLAREQKNWNIEQTRLNERMSALMETVDLNQAEVMKVKELRATIKQLEKENRQLVNQVGANDSSGGDKE